MGRETLAVVAFRGVTGECKILLESGELILRGGIKARLERSGLNNFRTEPAGLALDAAGDALHIAMPAAEAAKWIKALQTPPPSLASKLGLGPGKQGWLIGATDDADLLASLDGNRADNVAEAALLIAPIESVADLAAALADAQANAAPVWAVYPKGKSADPGDAAIRSAFRAAGFIDSKSCAVSQRLTATRYGRKV